MGRVECNKEFWVAPSSPSPLFRAKHLPAIWIVIPRTPVIAARINIDRLSDGRTGNSIAFGAQWALSNERFYRDHKMDAPS